MSRPEPTSPRRADRDSASAHSDRSGTKGERLAAAWLAARGHRIVARDLRTRLGEIDLLTRVGRTWIAVEVKARAAHDAPERVVDGDKLDRLERALAALAPTLRPRPAVLRVDVVAVRWLANGPEVMHFPALRQRCTRRAAGRAGAGLLGRLFRQLLP